MSEKVLGTDLTELVEMKVSKHELVEVYEDQVREELAAEYAAAKKENADLREVVKAVKAKHKEEVTKWANTVCKPIISNISAILGGAATPLYYFCDAHCALGKVDRHGVGADFTNVVGEVQVYFNVQNKRTRMITRYDGNDNIRENNLKVDLDVSPALIKKQLKELNKYKKQQNEISKKIMDIGNRIEELPAQIKKMKTNLTKKALMASEQGKKVLGILDQASKEVSEKSKLLTDGK